MPFATVGNQKFRIQFIHSSHKLKERQGDSGGWRVLADDLAKSLNRRLTLAEISRVTYIDGIDADVMDSVSYGIALCHMSDHFVKEEGRSLALYRALRNAKGVLTAEQLDAISQSIGYPNFDGLKARVNAPAIKAPRGSLAGMLYPNRASWTPDLPSPRN